MSASGQATETAGAQRFEPEEITADEVPGATPPIRVCLLGSPAAGKTCFLAGLAILAEPERETELQLHATGSSKDRLEELAATLRQGEWPPPTTIVERIEAKVLMEDEVLHLTVLDYPGEDFLTALRALKREEIEALYEHYCRSDVILLLFDPENDLRALSGLDPDRRDRRIAVQDAHLQAIRQVALERLDAPQDTQPHAVDVGVVLTKCDRRPHLFQPKEAERFFREFAAPLAERLRQFARTIEYFPLSAVGMSNRDEEEANPADEISPTGYERIFRWIVGRRRANRRRTWILRNTRRIFVLAAVLVLLTGFAAARNLNIARREAVALATLANPETPVIERIGATKQSDSPEVQQKRGELIDEEIDKLRRQLSGDISLNRIEAIREEVESLLDNDPRSRRGDVEQLKNRCLEERAQSLFEIVRTTRQAEPSRFPDLAADFLDDPDIANRELRKQVEAWLDEHERGERQEHRDQIRRITVEGRHNLRHKAEQIQDYLQRTGLPDEDKTEAERMRRATELALRFCQRNWYDVTLRRSGGFEKRYRHGVRVDHAGTEVASFDSLDVATTINWQTARFRLQWQVGESLRIRLLALGRIWNSDVAERQDSGQLALRVLGRREVLSPTEDWKAAVDDPFVLFEIEKISDDDWKALEDYISPGDKW